MKQVIYYKPQIGKNTKDVLRECSLVDQTHIKKVMQCYKDLALADPRPEFNQWFNQPNELLPRQPQQNNQRNTPRSFCDGIIEKLNASPNRRDLSPKQCAGIEALSREISEMYELGLCPYIVFENKMFKTQTFTQPNFDALFKKAAR